MNPEDGELRPRLLDRFGLCVHVRGLNQANARVAGIQRRQAYDAAPGRLPTNGTTSPPLWRGGSGTLSATSPKWLATQACCWRFRSGH